MPALPAAADRNFSAAIRINGEANEDLYSCIQRITVEEDLEQGSSFSIELSACRSEDGSWPYLDDENLRAWNRVTVYAAFPSQTEVVIDGYIAQLDIQTQPREGNVSVTLRGVDAAYHMNLEDKTRIWREQTYEDIAREVIESYGFEARIAESPEASGTPPAVSQRGTDHAFLRELARRRGYEFFVQGGTAFFRPPELTGTPQKLIAVNFGDETNCSQFQIQADGTAPTVATIQFLDPMTGAVGESRLEQSDLVALGTTPLSDLRGAINMPQTLQRPRRLGTMDQARADAYTAGLMRRNAWWVVANGRLNGLRYGQVLRSRKLVTVKGVGPTYNGSFYVRKVHHELTMRTYEMDFELVRNAVGKLGSEDFEGEHPDAMGLPASAADSDTVSVSPAGPRVLPA